MALNRFWSKVDQAGECWMWTAGRQSAGYGVFFFDGRKVLAHRFAYELEVGVIPDGMIIDHLCHERACVNPAHMRLATYRQNQLNRAGAQSNSLSGVLGVTWCKAKRKWLAQFAGKFVGYFDDIDDAAEAVRLNRIREDGTQSCR